MSPRMYGKVLLFFLGLTLGVMLGILYESSDVNYEKIQRRIMDALKQSNVPLISSREIDKAVQTKGSSVVAKMEQTDPTLHRLIKQNHMFHPSSHALPYYLDNPQRDPSMGQGQSIRKLFKNKTGGFFIECGALDGETRSNTLGLEKDLQWSGILIEGDQISVPKILSKNRKAFVVPHCLSTQNTTMTVSFGSFSNLGHIVDQESGVQGAQVMDVMCLPLYAILMALKVNYVDYFSLDVEGNELEILKTIPWDKVSILALSVEVTHIGETHTSGSRSEMESFMTSKGYRRMSKVTNRFLLANDIIFVKNGFNEDIFLPDIVT
ncbi:uncharacterized protein LOC131880967 [Tigriopus californicus]|uniref:uncharacterized protein LOC131880967 n=1 Tax=Tigriopus californicus TaxID=6832 RepID=UPI0027D9D353|nr:uncharacterized protein LOC131880967 [Tigriopus californicus]